MKKVIFTAGIAALTLVSCKKDFTCSCESESTTPAYTMQGESVPAASAKSIGNTAITDTRKKAEQKCNELTKTTVVPSVWASMGIPATTVKTECTMLN